MMVLSTPWLSREQRLSSLAPDARAEVQRALRAAVLMLRERARRRSFGWHTLDLGRYRVALRVQRHRLAWPLEVMLVARPAAPVPRAEIEALAEMLDIATFQTDDYPGFQVLIREVRLAQT